MDGASSKRQFFSITLPSIEKQILFLVTFQLIHGLKAFPLGLFANSEIRATTSKGLTLLILLSRFTRKGDFGYAGATTLIIFVISLTLTLLTRSIIRYLSFITGKTRLKRRLKQVRVIEMLRTDVTLTTSKDVVAGGEEEAKITRGFQLRKLLIKQQQRHNRFNLRVGGFNSNRARLKLKTTLLFVISLILISVISLIVALLLRGFYV